MEIFENEIKNNANLMRAFMSYQCFFEYLYWALVIVISPARLLPSESEDLFLQHLYYNNII